MSHLLNAVTGGVCLEFALGKSASGKLTAVSSGAMKGWHQPPDSDAAEHLEQWYFDGRPGAETRLIDAMAGTIGERVRSSIGDQTKRGFEIVHAILNAGDALHGILDVLLNDAPGPIAVRRLKKAIDENPRYRLPHVLLGDLYFAEGRFTQAAESYKQASTIPCASKQIAGALLNNLGCTSIYLGQQSLRFGKVNEAADHFAAAVQAFSSAIADGADDLEMQNNLAAATLFHSRSLAAIATGPDEAVQHLRKALEQALTFSTRFPGSDLAHLLQGNAFHSLADFVAGQDGLKFALEAKRCYELAVNSTAMGGYVSAAASYDLGSLLIRSAQIAIVDPSAGLQHLEECGRLMKTSRHPRPTDLDALMIRGYLALGRLDDARVLQGLLDSQEPGVAAAEAIRDRMEMQQHAEALQLCEAALNGHAADPNLNYFAGKALQALNRPGEAHEHLATALTANPAAYWFLTSDLAVHELREKRFREALRWFELAFLAVSDDLTREQLKLERTEIVEKYFESIFSPPHYSLLQRHARAFLDCLMEAELEYFRVVEFRRPFVAPFLLFTTAIETAFNAMLVGRILKDLKLSGIKGYVLPVIGRSAPLNQITMGSWKDLLRGAIGAGEGPQKASTDAVTFAKEFVARLTQRKRTGHESYADYLRRRVSDKLIGGKSLEDLRNNVAHPDATTFPTVNESDMVAVRREFLNVDRQGRRLDKNLPNYFEMLAEVYEGGA